MSKDEDLSIVLVGKVDKNFESNVDQIRRFYPKSQVIVSTFDELPSGFKKRNLIYVKGIDPGYSIKTPSGHIDNLGRQVIQNINGLNQVKTEYVLKIRTDLKLEKSIEWNDFVSDKISIPPVFFRDPVKFPFLFHPSDVAQFGKTELIRDFWRASTHEVASCKVPNRKRSIVAPFSSWVWHLVPEQRLFLNYINSRFGLNYEIPYATYSNLKLFEISENYLKEVFTLISRDYFRYPSHFQRIRPGIWSCYTNKGWNQTRKIDSILRKFYYFVNNFVFLKCIFLFRNIYLKCKYVCVSVNSIS